MKRVHQDRPTLNSLCLRDFLLNLPDSVRSVYAWLSPPNASIKKENGQPSVVVENDPPVDPLAFLSQKSSIRIANEKENGGLSTQFPLQVSRRDKFCVGANSKHRFFGSRLSSHITNAERINQDPEM